jgi:hypothetical protein
VSALRQLPNGDWVNPEAIVSVRAFPQSQWSVGGVAANRDRVVVEMRAGTPIVIECDSLNEAKVIRDDIAELTKPGGGTES